MKDEAKRCHLSKKDILGLGIKKEKHADLEDLIQVQSVVRMLKEIKLINSKSTKVAGRRDKYLGGWPRNKENNIK